MVGVAEGDGERVGGVGAGERHAGELEPHHVLNLVLLGVANPDQLRTVPEAVQLVRDFFGAGKPVAAICHAPWTLIEADVVRGRTLTSWPSLRTDVRNAGGTWVDEPVFSCSGGPNVLVTSRKPDDLPAFVDELTKTFAARGDQGDL